VGSLRAIQNNNGFKTKPLRGNFALYLRDACFALGDPESDSGCDDQARRDQEEDGERKEGILAERAGPESRN